MNPTLWVFWALWELLRYDLIHAALGFRQTYRQIERKRVNAARSPSARTSWQVSEAVSMAVCFYWKPVYCLQRSAVTARLLRASGVNARVVIGYRPSPFCSHAWVEVNGRVVNDSQAYKERMHVLCTF